MICRNLSSVEDSALLEYAQPGRQNRIWLIGAEIGSVVLMYALSDDSFDHLQMPYNCLNMSRKGPKKIATPTA